MATKMTREEAIKIVQSATVWTDEERDALAMLIPELAESEDERIRRKMIEHFKSKTKDTWCNMPVKSILAWLEKQKDLDKMIVVSPEVWDNAITDAYENGKRDSEKQKEQKLIRTAKEMWGEMRLEVYAQASGNRHEPNYSDDSTKMFSLCDIDEIFEKIGDSTVGSKPAEWSEEDEKDMAHIIRILDDCYVYGTHDLSKTDHENLVNKLKSLRPSWKPSEEQMKALSDACCIAFEEERCFHPSLSRLYHDLMELIRK